MRLLQLTQYLSSEEAESIITFLDDIRAMLVAHYGEEIRQSHRTRLNLMEKGEENDDF